MRESIDTVVNGVFQGISMAPMMLVVALLVLMRDLVIKILKVLPIMIRMAVSLLDPFSFIKDLLFGIMMGIEKLITGISDIFIGKAQESGEKIPGFKNGLFPNGIFGETQKKLKKAIRFKCLKPTTIRLILMILMSSRFAVFMKYFVFIKRMVLDYNMLVVNIIVIISTVIFSFTHYVFKHLKIIN